MKYLLMLLTFVFFFSCKTKDSTLSSEPYKAIPIDAFTIVQFNNLSNSINTLTKETSFWRELLSINEIANLSEMIQFADTLITTHEIIKSNLLKSPLLISFHRRGKNEAEYVIYLPLRYSVDDDLNKIILSHHPETKSYENSTINVFQYSKSSECCMATNQNVLIVSSSLSLLEEVLRQMQQPQSLLNDTCFTKALACAGKKVEANVFIHFKHALTWSENFLNTNLIKTIRNTDDPANWSALDLIIENDHLMLSGLSLTNNDNKKFLQIFQNQNPQEPTLISILPNTTSSLVFIGFSNTKLFFKNYHRFLNYNNIASDYAADIKEMNRKLSIDIESVFQQNAAGELGVCYTSANDSSHFYLLKVIDKEKMIADLRIIVSEKNRNKENFYNQSIEIFLLPEKEMLKCAFQNYFIKEDARYVAFIDQFAVFATSKENLKDFISLSLSGSKLVFNKDFENFNKNIPNKSNLLIYSNISVSKNFLSDVLNLNQNEPLWMKCFNRSNGACLQISTFENGLLYTNALLQFSKQNESGINTVWKCKLDTIAVMQPIAVLNHNTKQQEIMIQDAKNNLYLIDAEGRILWKKKIQESIMGSISQIDFFKNNKLQYIFNTSNFLFIIDRNGDCIDKFPIKLKQSATSPIAIVDYDRNKEYRIFVALNDKYVYCLNKEGKAIDGWNPFKTESFVFKIQYLQLADKDYIVVIDNIKPYFLNRKGEIRIRLSENFTISSSNSCHVQEKTSLKAEHFVACDSTGKIKLIYSDGHVESIDMMKNNDYYFDYQDFDEDKASDYIYSYGNKINVFNQNQKIISLIKVDLTVDNRPFLYKFDTSKLKIIIYSFKDQKVGVFDKEGILFKDASLHACSPALMYDFNNKCYIFVSNFDGNLYCYSKNIN